MFDQLSGHVLAKRERVVTAKHDAVLCDTHHNKNDRSATHNHLWASQFTGAHCVMEVCRQAYLTNHFHEKIKGCCVVHQAVRPDASKEVSVAPQHTNMDIGSSSWVAKQTREYTCTCAPWVGLALDSTQVRAHIEAVFDSSNRKRKGTACTHTTYIVSQPV